MEDTQRHSPRTKGEKERELLLTIAELAADNLFEYDVAAGSMLFMRIEQGEFVTSGEYASFREDYLRAEQVYAEDITAFERLCDELCAGVSYIHAEMRIYNPAVDLYQWYKLHGKTAFDEEGRPVRVVGKVLNISENKETELRLIYKSERDPLTKLYNKTTTRSLIKGYLSTDSRDTLDALIIIDVDDFKGVNDSLGHLFGDSILVDLSQEMQDLFRSSDVVGRIGGDEFLVLLRGVKHKKHVEDKASDICRVFELLYSDENGDKITGSLGISLFPQDGDSYEELFEKADIALYQSKGLGKNCYTFYEN